MVTVREEQTDESRSSSSASVPKVSCSGRLHAWAGFSCSASSRSGKGIEEQKSVRGVAEVDRADGLEEAAGELGRPESGSAVLAPGRSLGAGVRRTGVSPWPPARDRLLNDGADWAALRCRQVQARPSHSPSPTGTDF